MSGETGSDCMILAGDVSDNLDVFRATLICFTRKYKVDYEQNTVPRSLSNCCQAVLLHNTNVLTCSMSFSCLAIMTYGPGERKGASTTVWVSLR